MSQEPSAASLAADRPRRSSTARNTPAPEQRQPGAAGAWAGAGTGTGTGTALGGGNKRAKRPAPGVVSTTSSGGNSAVGKRKAAPRKKARAQRKEKGQQIEVEMEEVDDEGNPIDPEEPRYCLCNGVSFGTMIQCDNTDVSACCVSSSQFAHFRPLCTISKVANIYSVIQNCKGEWFHLECVNLEDIPARTTKWYCPDCRVALNIGEKGEVSARGVKK